MRNAAARPVLLYALLALGCSTTVVAVPRPPPLGNLAEVNGVLERRSAAVVFKGGWLQEPLFAEVSVGPDVTQLSESGSAGEARPRSVPTAALQQVVVVDRKRGAAEGLGWGALTGLGVGAIGGLMIYDKYRFSGEDAVLGRVVVLGTIGGGVLLGALIGTGIGAGVGHRTTVWFDSTPPPGR
jgi:hypothetical protein